ncbi:MAG: hypothetical protein H6709_22115 [Kofleriaceae bacterium]|nr:hypothetical protein [Kofleriaceae bacterium]MCB9574780.1 hypothetical protein [Kofleriaceae bacterium]
MATPGARRLARAVTLAVVAGLLALTGCYHGSLYAKRPADADLDHEITRMWVAEIQRVAHDGDWVLGRSLVWQGDAIVTLTTGEEFSHAGMIDVSRGTIVEATTPAVQEVPLEVFVQRYRYIAIVHPTGATDADGRAALEIIRSQLGARFDTWGMAGFDQPDRWYCSELVYWASGLEARFGRQAVLVPNELLDFGEVTYFSGRRDDAQIQAIAAARMARGHDLARN